MKKIIGGLVLIIALVACDKGAGDAGKFQIKGTVTNKDTGFVVLREVGDSSIIGVDSVKLNGNAFELNVVSKEKSFYYLDLFGKQTVFIVGGPGEKLTVTADGSKDGADFDVKGSVDNENMKKAVDLITAYQKEANGFQQKFIELQQTGKAAESEVLLKTADSAYNVKIEEAKKLITSFGASLPAMSLAANFISPKKDLAFLDELAKKMQKEMPKSRYTKNFVEFVESNKTLSIGALAPDFTASTPDDKWIKLSDFRGKVILLDFWASWCKPCRNENPNVVKLYNKFKGKGFEILSFSLDEIKDDWKEAIKADGLTWTHVSDLKSWASPVSLKYKLEGIPATYLLDKDGKIIAINLRGEELEKKIAEVLK